MEAGRPTHLFILGKDYHLGDLLWFTAVLAAYRESVKPRRVVVACPDRAISHILDGHPLIDELFLYRDARHLAATPFVPHGEYVIVRDLRPVPIAMSMLRRWRERTPWLYLRDLWLDERGQWLAVFLGLERLRRVRPVLALTDSDRATARHLPTPYVLLAPRTGRYTLPGLTFFWRVVKGWDEAKWAALAAALRAAGYTPITLAASGQAPIRGTDGLIGLPIRHVAGVIERATALITVESGLWYIAAVLGRPFIILPWWLPLPLDWAAPMGVPHRLIARQQATVPYVLSQLTDLLADETMLPAPPAVSS